MEERLFYEFCKLDLFDCEEDRRDLIGFIINPLKKGEIVEALNETYDWFEDVYDNLDSNCRELSKEDIKNVFEPIYHKVLNGVPKKQIFDLLYKSDVDKYEILEYLFTEDEIDELIVNEILERDFSYEEIKEDIFEIED